MIRAAIVVALLAVSNRADATVIKTRASAASYWQRLPLVLGIAWEFDTDSDASVHDFPLLIEYNPIEDLQLRLEPNFIIVRSKNADMGSMRGFGDMEAGAEYELWRELRYRPALSLETVVRLPTATDAKIGAAKEDVSLGAILSKDVVWAEFDFNVVYTYVGDPMGRSKIEFSAAIHKPLIRHKLEIEGELTQSIGVGSNHEGGLAALHGGATETAATVALAEQVLDQHLKIEEGGTVFNDLSWQVVFGLEYSFQGDD